MEKLEERCMEQSNSPKIKGAMIALKNLIGESDFNLLYALIVKVDEDFHKLEFDSSWNVDNIERAHNLAQSMYLMMQMIE